MRLLRALKAVKPNFSRCSSPPAVQENATHESCRLGKGAGHNSNSVVPRTIVAQPVNPTTKRPLRNDSLCDIRLLSVDEAWSWRDCRAIAHVTQGCCAGPAYWPGRRELPGAEDWLFYSTDDPTSGPHETCVRFTVAAKRQNGKKGG